MPPNERHPPKGVPSTSSTSSAPDQRNHTDGNPVTELLDRLIGLEVDGGCDDCTAYQTVERVAAGVYINHVWHDDTCPWIRHHGATP
jgi:hypothetical protein